MLPVSFFERAGQAFFDTVAVIDADGTVLGRYRKSHIPDGPGYEEKFWFSPGDTGFRVWDTRVGRIGVGICWDQWFSECARAMVLQGAELPLYPSAIGSEPTAPEHDSRPHWERTMCGHAAANLVPVAASNRIGTESGGDVAPSSFFGSSFICDATGDVRVRAGTDRRETVHGELRSRRARGPARRLGAVPRPAPRPVRGARLARRAVASLAEGTAAKRRPATC